MRGGVVISKSDCSRDVGAYTGEYSTLSGEHGFRIGFCFSLMHSIDDVILVYTCEICLSAHMYAHTYSFGLTTRR